VKINFQNDIAVMTIKGKLMGGKETDEYHQKVKDLIAENHNKIVVDLSRVKWLNSKGLGMLMACFTSCFNAKGAFKLAGATEKTNSLLMMTKLLTIFETFPSVDEAVASF
jgi:anti-sigma B factor antagonist